MLSGCGQLDPFESDTTPSDIRQLPADAKAADMAFLRDMIDQLIASQSLTAAALDPETEAGDDVARRARIIEEEDAGRIAQMAELLDDWGQASIASTNPDTEPAVGLTGAAFDDQWTVLIVEHHDQATALAEAVQRDGSSRSVNNLASGMLIDFGFETTTLNSR